MEVNRKKRLIIFIEVLLGALIAAIVTVVIIKSHGGTRCAPTTEVPSFELEDLKNVASHDNKSLVGLSGYLRFNSVKNVQNADHYMPIEPDNVTLTPGSQGNQLLILQNECAQITFELHRTGNVVNVDTIEVDPRNGNPMLSCSTKATGIYYGQDESYVCYSKLELPCYKLEPRDKDLDVGSEQVTKTKVVDLVIEVLRFEVNGDDKIIATGQFSKPPHFCV